MLAARPHLLVLLVAGTFLPLPGAMAGLQASVDATAHVQAGDLADASAEAHLRVNSSAAFPVGGYAFAQVGANPPDPVTPLLMPHQVDTIIQDDALVLHRTPQEVTQTLQTMKALGADRLRVTANWMTIAPAGTSKVRPDFDARDPNAYPAANWANLDKAAALATQQGLIVMIDVGFYAPLWATDDPAGSSRGITRPSPIEYGYFAEAVARRYNGTFPSLAYPPALPRVGTFTLWNEPNYPAFIAPQWNGTDPVSPDHYRLMLQRGYDAIKGVRLDPTTILVGGTSSTGGSAPGKGAVPPMAFLRRLACVDSNLAPLSTPGCQGFSRIPGDGWAHHPYELRQQPWNASDPSKPDDAMMGDLPRLVALLHDLVQRGRIAPALADLWLTEFGYETNDPVWNKPWTLEEQSRLLEQSEYLAWLLPEVRSYPQFLLRDIETQAALDYLAQGRSARAPGSWQSGLFWEPGFYGGAAKPAAASFQLTLLPTVDPANGDDVQLWGHVRPAPGPALAWIERSVDGGPWERIATWGAGLDYAIPVFLTDSSGYFLRHADPAAGAEYRLVWIGQAGVLAGPTESLGVEHAFQT